MYAKYKTKITSPFDARNDLAMRNAVLFGVLYIHSAFTWCGFTVQMYRSGRRRRFDAQHDAEVCLVEHAKHIFGWTITRENISLSNCREIVCGLVPSAEQTAGWGGFGEIGRIRRSGCVTWSIYIFMNNSPQLGSYEFNSSKYSVSRNYFFIYYDDMECVLSSKTKLHDTSAPHTKSVFHCYFTFILATEHSLPAVMVRPINNSPLSTQNTRHHPHTHRIDINI